MIGVILSFLINDLSCRHFSIVLLPYDQTHVSLLWLIERLLSVTDQLSQKFSHIINSLSQAPVPGHTLHICHMCCFFLLKFSALPTYYETCPQKDATLQIKKLWIGEIIDLSKCQWWQEGEQFYQVLTSDMWFTGPTVSMWHKIKSVIFPSKCKTHTFIIMHLFFFWFLPGCLSEMSCLCREKLRDSRSMGTETLAYRHSTGTSACMGDIRRHPATVSLHWDVLWALLGKFFSTSKVYKQRLVVRKYDNVFLEDQVLWFCTDIVQDISVTVIMAGVSQLYQVYSSLYLQQPKCLEGNGLSPNNTNENKQHLIV